ncbi:hypothetical protein EJB05_41019, partial [Eragrostis curvula]
MEEKGRRTGEGWGRRSPQATLAPQGPQPRRELGPSPQELRPHLGAAPSSEGPRPLHEPARLVQELQPHRGAAPSSAWPCPLRELAPSARDPGGDTRWWMESPASSPSSPGRASCPGLRAAASSLTDGDVVLKKRRLLQACRRSPAEDGETKEQRGQWWKKVEIGVDFVPDSQGGTDDDLVFVSASDASQIGDGSVAVRGDAEASTKGSISEIMNKYYGGVDRFHMLDGSRDVEDSQETMDEQLLLDDDAQAVQNDSQAVDDDELLVEDDSQAVDDDELLVEDDSQAVDDDELLVEDDSQAVDDDELLLVDDDSQPLTRRVVQVKKSNSRQHAGSTFSTRCAGTTIAICSSWDGFLFPMIRWVVQIKGHGCEKDER